MPVTTFGKAAEAVSNQLLTTCKNTSGGDTAIGDWTCLDAANIDEDTFAGTTPVTGILDMIVGVWKEIVPDGVVGIVQVAGYVPEANILGHASIVVGTKLKLVNGQTYATYDASADDMIVALEAYTTTTAALKKVFLRNRFF